MATFKPTTGSHPTPQGKKFQSNFNKTMTHYDVNLNEVDSKLNEAEQSLKKKIFSLAKMEALVFSDPKLSAIYEEMAENGEEKYGYHYNETIQNMIFNDHVLNDWEYLDKYKKAQPKEKKRRDRSGINQLKKKGEEMQTRNLVTKPKPKKQVAEGEEQPTPVLFLVNERNPKDPDLFAYFPEEDYDRMGNSQMGYSHIGQHSAVHRDYAEESREATPEEYKDLKAELEGLGYDLDVLNGQNMDYTMTEEDGGAGAMGGAIGATNSSSSGQYSGKLREDSEDYDLENRPDTLDPDSDCVISSNGYKYTLSCGGAYEGEFGEIEDALARVKEWKNENHYYPNTWFVSDHGNERLIDDDGNYLNETTGSASSGAYVGPAMWGPGDLMHVKGTAKVKTVPMIKGGTILEENYLVDSTVFEKYAKALNEADISYQTELGKDYQQSHTLSNNGLGVSEIPQNSERTQLKKGIDDNTSLYIGQDVDKMRDDDVKILHNDMTQKNSYFPHPNNPNLPNDGISGKAEEDSNIIDKTSAFTSDTVKGWNQPDTNTEMDTLNTGDPDKPDLANMEEHVSADAVIGSDVEDIQPRAGEVPFMLDGSKWEFETATYNNGRKDIVVYSYKDDIYYDYPKWRVLMGIDKNTQTMTNEGKKLGEMASSINQKISAAIALDAKKTGDTSKLKGASKEMAQGMNKKQLKDFTVAKPGAPKKVTEDAQSMIGDSPDSMSNKPAPIGTQSGNMDMGARSTGGGGMSESYESLLEEINKELDAFSIHHDKLKRMAEDRKPSALVLRDRVGSENEKNFKSDLKDSSVAKEVDIENALEWKDQQTDVPENPYELGDKLEKGEIKATDAKSGEALKNVGDSANDKGDEIPKRNLSDEEQDEVNLYRLGLGDLVYDNEVGKRFEDRMKADMGDKLYKQRQDKLAFRAKAPMYNKEAQPTEATGVDKVQFDKEKTGWNEREGIKESHVSGKYFDELGKKRIIDFNLNEVLELKSTKRISELKEVSLEGLGNTYTQKVNVNEGVVKAIGGFRFFTNGNDVFAFKNPVQSLNETAIKAKPVVNEQMDKMKHLVGYNTKDFIRHNKI